MRNNRFCETCGTLFQPMGELEDTCPGCLLRLGVETKPVSGPGGSPRLPQVQELAETLPGYEIHDLIAAGGMGAVYRARHRKLDRTVALKILLPGLVANSTFSDRFLREARTLANLNHAGIVTIFDFGTAEDMYFFAMEYVDGVTLRDLMREGRIAGALAIEIVKQVCQALHYAHERGVVHRDVKPENVLLDQEGMVKITDFGLAKVTVAADRTLTRADQVMGTPHYMAPEQVERPTQVDHRADLYSLGVLLYEMLTGELPLGKFALPSERGLDRRLDRVLQRALEKDPARRYQSALHLRTDLEGLTMLSAAQVVRRGARSVSKAVSQVAHYSEQMDLPGKVGWLRQVAQRVQQAASAQAPHARRMVDRLRSMGRRAPSWLQKQLKIARREARWVGGRLAGFLRELRDRWKS